MITRHRSVLDAIRATLATAKRYTAADPRPPKAKPVRVFRRGRQLGDERMIGGLRIVPDGRPKSAA